jgi:response regulator NasT
LPERWPDLSLTGSRIPFDRFTLGPSVHGRINMITFVCLKLMAHPDMNAVSRHSLREEVICPQRLKFKQRNEGLGVLVCCDPEHGPKHLALLMRFAVGVGCMTDGHGQHMKLHIVIVEPDETRARLVIESMQPLGHDVTVIAEAAGLARRVREIAPDIVLIDMSNPSRDMLEEMTLASGPMDRPVAFFVDKTDTDLTRRAIEAGVSAYVTDGLQPERVVAVMDAAIIRFQMFQRMRLELDMTRRALEERKLIDRAKGILMKARGISEEEAYALMRKTAMDQGRKVVDVASALVTAAGLLS